MDQEQVVEQVVELPVDALFSAYFPLPYRAVSTFIIGVWAWAITLQYLTKLRIDVESLLRFNRQRSGPPLYRSVYEVAGILTMVYAISATLFWMASNGSTYLAFLGLDILALSCFVAVPAIFFYPGIAFHRSGRYRFLRTLRRIMFGGLDRDTRFADILVADALTSYTKVIGDMWVMTCMVFSHKSVASMPDRTCGGKYVVPMIIAIPYIIRLRQCLTDYLRSGARETTHLLNAVKYITTFPVIILSAVQRTYSESDNGSFLGALTLYNLWVLCMVVNSLYSFYWDVTKDWDLTMFKVSSKNANLPHKGLRSILYFPSPYIYYAAVFVDFILRFTWSLKVSPHLYFFNKQEGGVFALEMMELLRRWVWLFLRIETEWIRTTGSGRLPLAMSEAGTGLHEAKD
ncbi:EXS family-domain-containing protein [Lipomyces chichibuensis]|uniref:EXS family-domain-containing protein n=1 Tax=Lipomyces chichibuensis TaxID=1546026 RepID=UPI003343A361